MNCVPDNSDTPMLDLPNNLIEFLGQVESVNPALKMVEFLLKENKDLVENSEGYREKYNSLVFSYLLMFKLIKNNDAF